MNIRLVAKKAGVATSTVSLALRNHPNVAAETRELILRVCRELSYVPGKPGRPLKRAGTSLSPKRTNRIALLMAGIARPLLYAPVYAAVLHGVEAALADQGKTMVLRHILPESLSLEEVLLAKVDGVLLFGSVDKFLRGGGLDRVPCVQMMRQISADESWDHVTYDNALIGNLAARHVLSRGHRHCAFVGEIPTETTEFLVRRGRDFKTVVEGAGGSVVMCLERLEFDSALEMYGVDPARMAIVVDQLLCAVPRPTAIFVEADMVAQALYLALSARGKVVGKDVEVISCNNEQILLANLNPRPATVDIHAEHVGKQAVEVLMWRMANAKAPRRQVLIEPTLVVR